LEADVDGDFQLAHQNNGILSPNRVILDFHFQIATSTSDIRTW